MFCSVQLIVERMRSLGPFISLHLRYEMDILAFTGCTHDLSAAEAHELWKIRYGHFRMIKGLMFFSYLRLDHYNHVPNL